MSDIKRTVTVFDQNTQEKTVIENVEANTLGELKTVLANNGISLYDMDIREGISRVDLKHDEAVLPHDTPYRGGTTNDLLILLTKQNKKVASGIGRSEASAYIKEHNLGDAIKAKYNKNWTNVSTADLVAFVESQMNAAAPCGCTSNLEKAFSLLVELLYENDSIDAFDHDKVVEVLNGAPAKKESDKGFSQDEINAILRGM